jgi:hypothetical protein
MVARAFPHHRRPTLSLDQQAARIRLRFPQFRLKRVEGELVIRAEIRPTEGSRLYNVRITYRSGHSPRVYVESPELLSNANREAPPHRFSLPGNPLCLYYGTNWEWTPHQYLADTIIPWTSEYLLFYELWLATGHWLGGGVEHDAAKAPDADTLPDAP